MSEFAEEYYTLSQEQGLCLAGDVVINLGRVAMIRKTEAETLVFLSGAAGPVALPAAVFDAVREAVFAIGDEEDADEDADAEDYD